MAEGGVPGYDAAAWQMVITPTKTPSDVLDKLHANLREFQTTGEFKTAVSRRGLEPLVTQSRPDLSRFVENEIVRWRKVVDDAGLLNAQ